VPFFSRLSKVRVRSSERDVLRSARREWVEFAGRRIALWRWGSGPAVLLAHGWSGHGGQLAAFVEPLVSTGFTVLAWDAPAHGRSEGSRTSPLEFVELLGLLARRERGVHAVIGHSLGAAAAALACADGAPIERVVFMGGAANPGSGDDTNVAVRVAGLARVQALVVHDRTDSEVPFSEGRRVADNWPGARFLATEGLGHRRIVRDERVVGETMRFLAEGTGLLFRSEAETVEFDLWHRHTRSGPYEIRRRVAAAGRAS
jgi:pimeloyl-ACP methyl ester carboxylesterase